VLIRYYLYLTKGGFVPKNQELYGGIGGVVADS